MSSHADEAEVDPWVVLRRLMAENRQLRNDRDELRERLDALERQLGNQHADENDADRKVIATPSPERSPDAGSDQASAISASVRQPPLPAPRLPSSPAAFDRSPTELLDLPDLQSFLRPWQLDALTAWQEAGHCGVVEAVTGAGKTFVGVSAARDTLAAGGRVVVIVPTTELQDQWWQVLAERLPTADIGKLGGGRQDELAECHVLVAIVNSAARRSLRGRPGDLLVADECHRYGAPTFADALEDGFDRRLGLTATFEREDDGVDTYLRPYFGDIVFSLWYDRALVDGVIARFDIALGGVDLTPQEQQD
jgi:superfamily II DNA or RNA helicase